MSHGDDAINREMLQMYLNCYYRSVTLSQVDLIHLQNY